MEQISTSPLVRLESVPFIPGRRALTWKCLRAALAIFVLSLGADNAWAQGAANASNPATPTAPIALANSPARAKKATTQAAEHGPATSNAQGTGTDSGHDLGDVVVQGPNASSVTPATVAAQELNQVSGGTSVIDTTQLKTQRLANQADALRFQPGVLAQSVNGGEATRLSLRGSGIIRAGFLFQFGNQLEIDGLRVYSASGNPYEEIEPLATSHIEVLRGSNGFDDGPLSLGGVINYVTNTGYDTAPVEARFEAGSYGYFHEQVSSGLAEGPFDYYASFTRFDIDGYRVHTVGDSTRGIFNFGYQITPDLTNRFKVIYAQQKQEDAGYLTWAQTETNPSQSQFPQVRSRQEPGSILLSDILHWQVNPDSGLEAGIQYNNYPINGPGGPAQTRFVFSDLSSLLRYDRKDMILGSHELDTRLTFVGYEQLSATFDAYNGQGKHVGRRPADQEDFAFIASNRFELFKNFWLEPGVAINYQTRATSISLSTAKVLAGTSISRDYFYAEPRFGVRYDVTPTIQLFANVSRSVDTPSANSYIRTDAFQVPLGTVDLKSAQAYTAEVGARGEWKVFRWSVDYYHSWIDNELLTVPVVPGSTATITSNASSTHHEGVEVNLDTTLWEAAGAAARDGASKNGKGGGKETAAAANNSTEAANPHRVVLRQAYTWNHFYFDSDPVFGDNQLAGVPEHIYQAELDYEHPSGFYIGVNVDSVFTHYPIDFANTVEAHPYAVLGAKIGYNAPPQSRFKGLELFVEFRNLTDETYAPVVVTTYNAKGLDVPVFSPAPGRSVYGGISYRF